MERDRPERRCHVTWRAAPWWLLGLSLLLSAAGCSAMAGVMYLVKGYEQPPEYPGLKGKHVVVVCRPPADDQYRNVHVAEQLAKQLSAMLAERVPKIEVVDHRKVARWTDENQWVDSDEVGKALDADTVVTVDLDSFSIYQGQTLFQGQAHCRVSVLDLNSNGAVVFEKHLPPSVYPPNTGIPTSEREEEEFRREYIGVLADEVGRCFYSHDALEDISRDSDAVLR